MNPKSMKLSFLGKNVLLSSVNIVFISLIMIFSSYYIQEKVLVSTLNEQSVAFSKLSLGELNLADIKESTNSKSNQVGSPLQKKLTNQLEHYKKANSDISQSYIFTVDLPDGKTSTLLAVPTDYLNSGYNPGATFELSPILQSTLNKVKETKEAQTTGIYENSYGEWLTVIQPVVDENGKVIAAFAMDLNASIVEDGKNELLMWSIPILIVALIAVLFTQFVTLRKVLTPIKELIGGFGKVSEGQLDVQLPTKRKDELGLLNTRFNEMVTSLREIIQGVQQHAQLATKQSNELAMNVEQNTKSLTDMSRQIDQVASGAKTQEQVAVESSRAMEEVAVGIQRVAESSSSMAEAAEEMSLGASQGNEFIEKVIRQMNRIDESVDQSSASVISLSDRSQEIVQIADVITGIASQTNLLALNAAIEAARAGEQGRGFAVVANEVRKLAEQSEHAAGKIGALIEEIQQGITHAVEKMNNGTQDVKQGMHIAEETGNKFQSIFASTRHVSDLIQDISAVAQEMSAGSEEVSSSVQELAQIASKSSSHSTDVAASSEQQLISMKDIDAAAVTLSEMSQQLQGLISKFKL
ncbi:methyl-accepting chemotaxis protein [Paenibacillus pini]